MDEHIVPDFVPRDYPEPSKKRDSESLSISRLDSNYF